MQDISEAEQLSDAEELQAMKWQARLDAQSRHAYASMVRHHALAASLSALCMRLPKAKIRIWLCQVSAACKSSRLSKRCSRVSGIETRSECR